MFELPENVQKIFEILRGEEIYLIGGCVRDMLLSIKPLDYDFACVLRPQILRDKLHANGIATIDVGIRYGTLGVLLEGEVYEITTFRKEGVYLDARHPSSVEFAKSLAEDVRRRDFSINAIAYHPKGGIVDLVGGVQDLEDGVLRAIGDAQMRFFEDSLRILRGVGFVARFGLHAESNTYSAMLSFAHLLDSLPRERISKEWEKIICAPFCLRALKEFAGVFVPLFGESFASHVCRLKDLPDNPLHRAAKILQDEALLDALCYPKAARGQIAQMMQWCKKDVFVDKKSLKYVLAKNPWDLVRIFLQGDARLAWLEEILAKGEPCRIKDLCIHANDLEEFPPKFRGKILSFLLSEVIEERVANESKDLKCHARQYYKSLEV
ncbi:CCA tRNA nucleotidyltransferase [Helicobacter mustelae]|uniref:Putative poly(A) polymerase n=1 Tax=Helicobacter mustelae (strain ATCC 43772 / CCUG 25715 / CIP 103759 / LMG 18044 / NCTC 12198 / R85-136P) TaxID=679897 RepID=D3UGG8_HELM1|nr:CCA tRNA nucleotidyltransferase [Helicobacter mustelae]CBG39589.1 putative poly(A) polymerase [Helicobacter mustelae 12198]SQH71101.1 poly(A) polymerase [Helicobacter mustelae]